MAKQSNDGDTKKRENSALGMRRRFFESLDNVVVTVVNDLGTVQIYQTSDNSQKKADQNRDSLDVQVSRKLVSAAAQGSAVLVNWLLNENIVIKTLVDINCADRKTGFTALHYAAARESKVILKILIRDHNLNYLVKDKKGRLPSTLAFEVAENPVIGTFLMKKEMQQAKRRGIDYRALLVGEASA